MASAGDESPPLQLSDFQADSIRGSPGFVRVGRSRPGSWWLIGPDDRAFFACGVQLDGSATPATALEQAAGWGFNTVVVADDRPPAGWAGFWIGALRFRPEPEAMIRLQGVQLPDVFDPGWAGACQERTAVVYRQALTDSRLIGWLPDPDLQWAQAAVGLPRPSLLQICLSLEPRFAAYHAAWEFVLAAHGGELASVGKAWETGLPNKESLRQLTHDDQALQSVGYRHDDARFTKEFARLYFTAVAAAIRAQDPAHLVIAMLPADSPAAVADGAVPLVDGVAIVPGAVVSAAQLDAWTRHAAYPVFLPGYSWAGGGLESLPGRTPLEHMLARGRSSLGHAIAHPAAVGYAWRDWCDLPGESPPFGSGLVRVDGGTAREHTDLLTEINLGAEARRRAPRS